MEVLGEINNFCRFCLSQYCETLMPLSVAIESFSFSVQDILETTGISILETETTCLSVCTKCGQRIELAVDFRRMCLDGNILFMQQFGHIIDKLRSGDIAEENLEDAADAKNDPLEIEITLQSDTSNGSNYDEHNEPVLLEEESIELFKEPTTNRQEDCASITNLQEHFEDENCQSVNVPLVHTLRSKQKATSMNVAASISIRKSMKSKERVENSEVKKSNTSNKNFKRLCGICGALVSHLHDHIRSHTKENLLQCPHCPVQMAYNANLRAHVRAVHEKVVIKSCEPCGKGFTTNNAYKSHMRTHHNIGEQYQCEICLKIFNHASSRLLHFKRIHIAEWKYECQICQKKFKNPNSLRLHGRVHSTNAPYACSLCPKRFKSPQAKKTHEITHSGIDFPCTLCSKVYRYKTLLNMHYRKCHPTERSAEST
ncbi:zinc finger protein 77-like isoform X4 [Anopheles albimanus]|uniref:zinc finger protein 77-like isoform X4 n=1 Tax=Anopheles albimanus TaxID=7167 RepID=UPI0016420698|nr:zinc finger protein 77-like isoform X4 [Anopheles albimanus]